MQKSSMEALNKRIAEIDAKSRDIRQKREELNSLVSELAKRRNDLNSEVIDLISYAKEQRNSRPTENEKISTLKKERDEIQAAINLLKERLSDLNQQKSQLTDSDSEKSSKRRLSAHKLRKMIHSLEWKLQTTSNLGLEEEKSCVEQIARLENQLKFEEEVESINREIGESFRKSKSMRAKLRSINHELRASSKNSRHHHREMVQAFKKADEIRKEADKSHQEFLIKKKEADATHQEYVELIQTIRELSTQISKIRHEHREKQQAAAKERMEEKAEDALGKFKSGGKLSFEEFRSLIDRGLI